MNFEIQKREEQRTRNEVSVATKLVRVFLIVGEGEDEGRVSYKGRVRDVEK